MTIVWLVANGNYAPIECAARALSKLDGHPRDAEPEGRPLRYRYVPQVLVVLDAIHEPSLRMTEAGATIIKYVGPDEAPSSYQGDAANVWRFMLGAMRDDGPFEA